MTLQILLATMNQIDYSKLEDVNVTTAAIVVNQCDSDEMTRFEYKGNQIVWINTTERGLSRSRNMALKYATADICLLVDDDERLVNEYEKIILNAFGVCEQADLLTFNIHSIDNVKKRYMNTKNKRLHLYNIMRYGSARIAFKKNAIDKKCIRMNVYFGAGSVVSNGEDSIFLHDCLENGLKAYSWPETIANINDGDSTWFCGYTEQFFVDKGMIFAAMSPTWNILWCIQYVIRHKKLTNSVGTAKAFLKMIEGSKKMKAGKMN